MLCNNSHCSNDPAATTANNPADPLINPDFLNFHTISTSSSSSSAPKPQNGFSSVYSVADSETSAISAAESEELSSEISSVDELALQQMSNELSDRNNRPDPLSTSEIFTNPGIPRASGSLGRISSEPSLIKATDNLQRSFIEGLRSPLIGSNHVRIKSVESLASPVAPSLTGRQSNRYDGKYRLVCGVIPFKIETVPVFDKDQNQIASENQVYILLVRSSKNDYWIFPKGGWENFESSEQAAQRECLEEAGVEGEIIAELGNYSWSKKAKHSRLTSYLLQVTVQHESFAEDYRDRVYCPVQFVRFFVQREEAKYFLERGIEKLKQLGLVKEDEVRIPSNHILNISNDSNEHKSITTCNNEATKKSLESIPPVIDGRTIDNSILLPIPKAPASCSTPIYTGINSGPNSTDISPRDSVSAVCAANN
jgi:8-oxo-dGTP pyrophosphatase MutT (NUDIX family)